MWAYTLKLKSFWGDNSLSIQEKGKKLSEKIYMTFPNSWFDDESQDFDDSISTIADEFKCVDDVEHFNQLMDELYDWADQSIRPRTNMCWVETVF